MTTDLNLQARVLPLLDYLAAELPHEPVTWKRWDIRRVAGGLNNLLFRATNGSDELAIKFTRRDWRQRAQREYQSLSLLAHSAPRLAPRPLSLIDDRYAHPVVVQEWLAGPVEQRPPNSQTEWCALLEHLAAIHQIRSDRIQSPLQPAVVGITSCDTALARIHQAYRRVTDEQTRTTLQPLLRRLHHFASPAWSMTTPVLCRCDPNTMNFIRRPGRWASVDWENSGWGDPAFEMGDLLAHPAYSNVPMDIWHEVVNQYCDRMQQEAWAERIWLYYRLTMVWWAITFTRIRHELAAGKQPQSLAERPHEWAQSIPHQAATYLERAYNMLETWNGA